MIFVTVGTNPTMHFDRLIKPMDELAAQLDEPVVIQCGCSSYQPRHADSFQFTTTDRIEALNREARVIVSHAAAGSVIVALQARKPVVVVPRRHHLGEHIDDHQLELATALDQQGKAVAVYEPDVHTLDEAIRRAAQQQFTGEGPARLIHALRAQMEQWMTTSETSSQSIMRRL